MTASVSQPNGSRILQFFCRHLVALCITYQQNSDSGPTEATNLFACPGTVICVRNMMFFVTAGHTLKEWDKLIRRGEVIIHKAVLADTFGLHRVSEQPIPFDFVNEPRFFIDDEAEGLDFGLIPLSSNHVRLLAANGIVALFEENWIHQSKVAFDAHFMLGLPTELMWTQLSPEGNAMVTATMFRVHRLESPPEDTRVTRYPRFVGRLDSGLPLNSLKGMSGGPIFGISFGPPMRYWIAALQSSWRPDLHIAFGCPLPVFAGLLTQWNDSLSQDSDFTSSDQKQQEGGQTV